MLEVFEVFWEFKLRNLLKKKTRIGCYAEYKNYENNDVLQKIMSVTDSIHRRPEVQSPFFIGCTYLCFEVTPEGKGRPGLRKGGVGSSPTALEVRLPGTLPDL